MEDTLLLYMAAVFTAKGLFCALVDTDDAFDCVRAESFGIAPNKVLRICCKQKRAEKEIRPLGYARKAGKSNNHNSYQNNAEKKGAGQRNHGNLATSARPEQSQEFNLLEQAFKATDILLHNGGFGLIAVDLSSIDESRLRKVPMTTWFRFAHVADDAQTALIFMTRSPIICSCTSLKIHTSDASGHWSSNDTNHVDDCCASRSQNTAIRKKAVKPQDDPKLVETHVPHSETGMACRTVRPIANLLTLQKTHRIVMEAQCQFHMAVLKDIRPEVSIVQRKQSIARPH